MEPYLVLPLVVGRAKAYDDLLKTPTVFRVWNMLVCNIVRSKQKHTGKIDLYKEYYLKNKLAARWSRKNMAIQLDLTERSVSSAVSKLEQLGYLEVDRLVVYDGSYNVYILGSILPSGDEVLYLHQTIRKDLVSEEPSVEEKLIALESQPFFTRN